MLLSEAFEQYARDVILFSNQSRKTEENHRIAQRALIKFTGDIDLLQLDFQMVRNWKEHLEKGRSAETVRCYIIKLRVVLGYHRKLGTPCLDPDAIPVPKRTDKVPSFISESQVAKLINSFDIPRSSRVNRLRNQAIVATLYASGIRVSELCSLNRDSLHDGSFTIVGKGGKARLCFLDERSQTLIKKYLTVRKDSLPALFISAQTMLRISPATVQIVFRLARNRTGVEAHPHTMRHSFSTNFLRNNGNMRYLQVMLGHSSLETTQMYSHVVDEDLRKIYAEHHTI